MNSADKRIEEMIETLRKNNGMSVRALALELGVTEMTIRRDVKRLKTAGIVKNVSGAILLDAEDQGGYRDYITKVQEAEHLEEKTRIGEFAASLIEDNDVIYVDVGTTSVHVINGMQPELENVMVVVSTINAVTALQKKNYTNYCLTGGFLREKSEMLVSAKGVEMLKGFSVTKAFISAAGVNAKLGVTCVNNYEVDYKKTAIDRALKKYLLADSSKFGAVRMNYFANLSEFDAVITDSNLSEEWRQQIRDLGIELYLC